ncbi:MAG: sialidase family protein [Planctomycetota bacterium]|jgi:hypothetical protein
MFSFGERRGGDASKEVVHGRSLDGGRTMELLGAPDGLQAREIDGERVEFSPPGMLYHRGSGTILAVGATATSFDHGKSAIWTKRSMAYSVYDPKTSTWSPFALFDVPGAVYGKNPAMHPNPRMRELEGGDVLIPFMFLKKGGGNHQFWSGSLRASFDGRTLGVKRVGSLLTVESGSRGLFENHFAKAGGVFYMTMRANDGRGYVSTSGDGLEWGEAQPWRWDSGKVIAMDDTQTRLLAHGNDLLLVYTRIGKASKEPAVFRHRAPLFSARVDTETLRVIRATERVLFPNRGHGLGNFYVGHVDENQSWVMVSEWIRKGPRNDEDVTRLARLFWRKNSE